MQIKHIGQDKNGYFIKVDGKTTARPIRLIKSTPSLASWLSVHPFKNNPNAPLWPNLKGKHYGDQLTYKGVRGMLEKRAKRAGLNKRFYMYLNRHSEITNTVNFLTEGQLRKRHGWTPGSKSPEIYTHLNQTDVDDAMMKHYGVKKEEKDDAESDRPKICSICEMHNDPKSEMCSKCGKPLDLKTALEQEEKEREENNSLREQMDKIRLEMKEKDEKNEKRFRMLEKSNQK